jgi:hypothetical protein
MNNPGSRKPWPAPSVPSGVSELGRSFSFPFRHPAWLRRLAVGAALELIPLLLLLPMILAAFGRWHRPLWPSLAILPLAAVVGLICRLLVLGYLRRIAKGVLDGTSDGLPAWDRPAEDFVEGLKIWLVAVVLWLPAVAVTVGAMFLVMALASPSAAWVPIVLLGPPAALATLAYLPAGLLATVAEEDVSAAFNLDHVAGTIGRALGPYALAFLVAFAAEIIAQFGLLFCCVGIFATRFAAHCVAVHAFSTAYRQGVAPAVVPVAGPSEGSI